MENAVIVAILAVIVFAAAYYIFKQKKNGKKCIGCPYNGSCAAKCCEDGCCETKEKNQA